MHVHIDDDIENEECKIIFKHELQKGMEKLCENIKKRSNECKERFIEEIKKDIKQFEERIKDSLIMLDRTNLDSGFDSNFNIHSGIDTLNTLGLLSSIASLVFGLFNFWNPVGWESIGLGLTGIVKSVWSWFSSDHKKSQQKKEVDKNLDKVCGIIEERVRNQLKSYKKIIFEKVESLKAGLNDPVVCYERMREGLIKAGEGLWQISNNIKTRIAQ
ncbi:apolipoL family protein [Helicobacter pylori]|nr:apolipoL family protein [Helicobacter pylori]